MSDILLPTSTTQAERALEQGAAILAGLPDPLRGTWQRMLLELGRLLHWSLDPSGSASTTETLLPPNATAAEHRLEQSTARLGELPSRTSNPSSTCTSNCSNSRPRSKWSAPCSKCCAAAGETL